jgi:hypothetical protein
MEGNISQQSENTQTPPRDLSNSDLKSKLPPVSVMLLLLVLVGTAGFFLGKSFSQPKTSPPPISQISQTPTTGIPNPTPTPDPTANWKTYVNTKYGLKFKYPEERYLIEEDSEWLLSKESKIEMPKTFEEFFGYPPPKFLFALKMINKKSPQDLSPLRIWGFSNEENKNIDEWYEKYRYYPFNWGKAITSIIEENRPKKEIVIGKKTGKFAYLEEMGKIKYIYLPLNKEMLLIRARVNFNEPKNQEIPDITSEIISTLEFLEDSGSGRIYCKEPRPDGCTMECLQNPPYICGSNEKSYCTTCQACSDREVEWYVIQDKPCREK